MLRRAGARGVTLQTLSSATRRRLAERLGLSRGGSAPEIDMALTRRAPELAARMSMLTSRLNEGERSDKGFLALARELHSLAYPSRESSA
jgi:hypothetical protein